MNNFSNTPQQGWICPRCGKVNAPWMPNCDCKPSESQIKYSDIKKIEWNHNGNVIQSEVKTIKYLGDRMYFSVKENDVHSSGIVSETYVQRILIGDEEGRRRYESRMKSFKETWDSKTEEELKEINYKKALGCCERVSSASIKFFDKLVQRLKDEGIDKNYTYIYGFKKSDEGNTNKESNEVYIFDEKTSSWYFYDFCCVELRLIIEYNGSMFHPKPDLTEEELEEWQSYKFQNKGTEQRGRDLRKEEICNEMGLNFLTVWDDVKEKDNIEMVVDYIKSL